MMRRFRHFALVATAALAAGLPPAPASVEVSQRAGGFDFRRVELPPNPGAGAAIALTGSDGTGLRLVAVEADAVLEPPLAFTELRLRFHNPEPRLREGRFRIVLPPGAAISRLAMKIGDHWQEGEVVERQKARRAYEDFLHRRQDPALLEQAAGNEFTARVFPIPPRADKELIISYSHELAGEDEPYVLPLAGLPEIERLDVRVLVARYESDRPASNLGGQSFDHRVVRFEKRDYLPTEDLRVAPEPGGPAALRNGDVVVARVGVPVGDARDRIDSLFVLVDTSASRALGMERQLDLLDALLAGLAAGGGEVPLAVAAFDQSSEPIYEGSAEGWDGRDKLAARGALGASDLGGALSWLAEHLKGGSPNRYRRLLIVTDGVVTAGEREAGELAGAVQALRAAGIERLDALVVGGRRDEAALAHLVTAGLERDGVVVDGDGVAERAELDELGRRLSLAAYSGLEVEVPGARWVWPRRLDGVQAGDRVLVYADLPGSEELRVKIGDGGLTSFEPRPVERPLLERAWVKARIARLLALGELDFADDPDLAAAMRAEVIELSVQHRVLSPLTALLVLETEADYTRYGIDRRSLADVLTVGSRGIEVVQRTGVELAPLPPVRPEVRDRIQSAPRSESGERAAEAAAPGADDSLSDLPVAERRARLDQPAGELGELMQVAAGEPEPEGPVSAPPPARQTETRPPPQDDREESGYEPEQGPAPHEGRFHEILTLLDTKPPAARRAAETWVREAPGDVLALVALGRTCEAMGDVACAVRAYGSLIDLFPARADLRRFAGELLSGLRPADRPRGLIIDTFRTAVEQRPDHPSSHRLLAWALVDAGRFEEAFEALTAGVEREYPAGRFAGVAQILREDLGLIAAGWARAEPAVREAVTERLRAAGGEPATRPSVRFLLHWETDANDVDLHVDDGRGNHADYRQKEMASGGRLYADVTTGYGPECFAVEGSGRKRAYPYRLRAHYYRRGPMGYGMGVLQVIDHDGNGGLTLEARPFVVMVDGAYLDLGMVK